MRARSERTATELIGTCGCLNKVCTRLSRWAPQHVVGEICVSIKVRHYFLEVNVAGDKRMCNCDILHDAYPLVDGSTPICIRAALTEPTELKSRRF